MKKKPETLEEMSDLSAEEIEQIIFENLLIEGVFGPDDDKFDPFDKDEIMKRHASLHEAFVIALKRCGVGGDPEHSDGEGPTERDREEAREICKRLNLGRKPN